MIAGSQENDHLYRFNGFVWINKTAVSVGLPKAPAIVVCV